MLMCLFIINIFILGTTIAFGHGVERPQRAVVTPIIEQERIEIGTIPLVVPLIRFEFRQGGRNWSSVDQSREEIGSSFNEWLRCHHTDAPDCEPCEETEEGVHILESLIVNKCLPAARDKVIAYSSHLNIEQRLERDTRICSCLQSGEAGALENFTYNQGTDSRAARTQLQENGWMATREEVREELEERVANERFLNGFTAMNLVNSRSDGSNLAGRYSAPPKNSRNSGWLRSSRERAFEEASSEIVQNADRLEMSQEMINSTELPQNFCLPYRYFIGAMQFPSSGEFFEDLNSLTEWRDDDWNYIKLLEELARMKGNRREEEFQRDPRVRRLSQRVLFLQNNPVYKNIFMSGIGGTSEKRKLFDLVKQLPRPQCRRVAGLGLLQCNKGEDWSKSLNDYRNSMAGFLARTDVNDIAKEGADNFRRFTWRVTSVQMAQRSATSERVLGSSAPSDASRWRSFCSLREQAITPDPTVSMFRYFENDAGQRDAQHPQHDERFVEVSRAVCEGTRTNVAGARKSFPDFLRERCGASTEGRCSAANRVDLVTEFLNLYPDSEGGEDSLVANDIIPYLRKVRFEDFTDSEVANINRVAQDPRLSRSAVAFTSSELIPQNELNGIATPSSQASATRVASSATEAPAAVQFPVAFTHAAPENPVFAPLIPGETQAAAPESVRESVSDKERDAREIREEISSLRDVLRKDPAEGGPRDTEAMANLNSRLAALERNLGDKEREITELRRSRTPVENEREASPSRVASQAQAPSATRSQTAAAAQSVGPSGGVSGGGATTAAPTMGGATTSGVSSSAPARVPAASSRYSALLSKYGFRESGEQGGITVALASGNIDYQQLRSETENSVLPLVVSPEEFNLLSQSNQAALSRYLDQVKALPGEVVRINLSSGDRVMEMYVLKSGDQISFVPAQEVAVQRAPASVAPDREFRLKDLQNELPN